MSLSRIFTNEVFVPLSCFAIFKFGTLYYMSHKHRKFAKEFVGTVRKLFLYPIKSTKGIEVSELQCSGTGVSLNGVFDRHWLIVSGDKHVMQTAREIPRMVLVSPSLADSHLILSAPDMPTIKVPIKVDTNAKPVTADLRGDEVLGVDCGDEVASWLSEFLGKADLRLICSPQWLEKKYVDIKTLKRFSSVEWGEKLGYQDNSSLSILCEASLDDLNARLQKPVYVANFRPTILSASSSEKPYDEDEWREVDIGDVALKWTKNTDRCLQTTVDPETGVKSPDTEPLRTLRTYRILSSCGPIPCLATNLEIVKPGSIRVGDKIFAVRN